MRTTTRMMMMSGRNRRNGGGDNGDYGRGDYDRGDYGNRNGGGDYGRRDYGRDYGDERGETMRRGERRNDGHGEWGEEGGGYAGNFRSGAHSREHEADEVKFDEHKAKEWVERMKNSDGTTGAHFKQEMAEQLRASMCPDCDKTEFWAAMNMMYSDYCEVAKKMNIDRPEYYGHMAKAFLMDQDAGKNKLAKYMKYVAKKE